MVVAGEPHPGAVGLELCGGQEGLFGVFFSLRDVVHRHRGCGVPGVALQHFDGQAEFGEAGQASVPEPVGMTQPHRSAGAIDDRDDVAELAQHGAVTALGVGLGAGPVAQSLHEQEPRGFLEAPLADPLLLLGDDRGDLAVHQDVVRRVINLALGVVELGDLVALGRLDGAVGHRGQALERAGADLAHPSAGEDLQQDHAHRLGVLETGGEDSRSVTASDQQLLVAR